MGASSPMQNADKRLRLGLGQNFSEGKDTICSLPDSILHHILSFLDTKEAIKTSILSKRWELLWTSISKLEFKEDKNPSFRKREEFMDFVERALLLRDPHTLYTFNLTCTVPSYEHKTRINTWIAEIQRGHKVEKMVLVLNLQFDNNHGSFEWHDDLFAYEFLEELTLDFLCDLWLPSNIYFQNLKILTLSQVIFIDRASVERLLFGCPQLHKLDLVRCKWDKVKTVCVSASNLEHLQISESHAGKDTKPDCCQFMISGPRLKVFHYTGGLVNEYRISEASSLVDAHIDVHFGHLHLKREAAYHAHKLFEGLANVKDLRVSSPTFHVLADAEELLPCLPFFHNLNHFEVISGYLLFSCEAALLKIIHNSPHLESIHFATTIWEVKFSAELDPVPPCFLTHLKKIKVDWFIGRKNEVNTLMTMVKYAKLLESIELGYKTKNKNNVVILDLLKLGYQEENKNNDVILDLLKERIKSTGVFFRNLIDQS